MQEGGACLLLPVRAVNVCSKTAGLRMEQANRQGLWKVCDVLTTPEGHKPAAEGHGSEEPPDIFAVAQQLWFLGGSDYAGCSSRLDNENRRVISAITPRRLDQHALQRYWVSLPCSPGRRIRPY